MFQSPDHHLNQEETMDPKGKRNDHQTHLWLPQGDLWEKLPEANRDRCRQLLGQMLQAVVQAPLQTRREDERQD